MVAQQKRMGLSCNYIRYYPTCQVPNFLRNTFPKLFLLFIAVEKASFSDKKTKRREKVFFSENLENTFSLLFSFLTLHPE
jgi:hypothetical protein